MQDILDNIKEKLLVNSGDHIDDLNIIIPMIEKSGEAYGTDAYIEVATRAVLKTLARYFKRRGHDQTLNFTASMFFHMISDLIDLDNGELVALSDYMNEEQRMVILKEVAFFVETQRILAGLPSDQIHCELVTFID